MCACWPTVLRCSIFFFKIYLFLDRGREEERERNINVWLPLTWPPPGTQPATQACALPGNWTGDPLVPSPCSIHWAIPARTDFLFFSNKIRDQNFFAVAILLKEFKWPNSVVTNLVRIVYTDTHTKFPHLFRQVVNENVHGYISKCSWIINSQNKKDISCHFM